MTVPFADGSDALLTFGGGIRATWTPDRQSLVYVFKGPIGRPPGYTRTDSTGSQCLGSLPASGGTQHWSLCDLNPVRSDSSKEFDAAAVNATGRLLYFESVTPRGMFVPSTSLGSRVLWLADTTTLGGSVRVGTLPMTVNGRFTNWLTKPAWLSENSFLILGELRDRHIDRPPPPPGQPAPPVATVVGTGVLRGDGALLTLVSGTLDAQTYTLSDDAASIIFARGGRVIERVPVAGGTPDTLATLQLPPDVGDFRNTIFGIDCHGGQCIVMTARQNIYNLATGNPAGPASLPSQVYRVTLSTGAADLLYDSNVGPPGQNNKLLNSPLIAAGGHDVIVELSGTLRLYRNFIP